MFLSVSQNNLLPASFFAAVESQHRSNQATVPICYCVLSLAGFACSRTFDIHIQDLLGQPSHTPEPRILSMFIPL